MQRIVSDILKLQRELHSVSEERDKAERSARNEPSMLDQHKITQLNTQAERLKAQLGKAMK